MYHFQYEEIKRKKLSKACKIIIERSWHSYLIQKMAQYYYNEEIRPIDNNGVITIKEVDKKDNSSLPKVFGRMYIFSINA